MRRIEDPLANVTLFEYDERANLTKRTDALSRITAWSYDGLDRMIQETNAISGLTTLGYDAASNVVTVTDPMQSTTRYGYDGLSRLISVTQPLGQTVRYEWDARDRLAKKILARTVSGGSSEHPEIRYAYETWGPLNNAKHYAYASAPTPLKTITYLRNRAGALLAVTDDAIQATPLYSYTVDKLGRTTKTIAKYIPGGDRTLDYGFDARGDMLSFTLTEPNEVLAHAYTYAPDSGRIATATFPGSATPITITRWPHDGEKLVTYPGGVTREVDYDVRGPVSEIRIKPPSGTPLVEKWAYAYTDVRNVATMTDAASRVTTYGYDNLDRLTSADHPTLPPPLNTLPDLETFTYDGVGNRTMSGYAHDANHRMRASPGRTVDYDDDGNTKVRDPGLAGQATYTWDQDNRLTAYASGATSASYRQDPFARRFKKTVGSTTTWYLWAGDHLLAEYSGTGTRSARYTQLDGFAPAQMAVPNGGSELIYSLHSDRLDTPRVMTSSAGSVVWQAAYEAYGTAHLSTGLSTPLNFRLPGQYLDAESGAHYNRFRYYYAVVGRYISADPIGQRGGLNLSTNALNSPTTFIDPFGLFNIADGLLSRFRGGGDVDVPFSEVDPGVSPSDFPGFNEAVANTPPGGSTEVDLNLGVDIGDIDPGLGRVNFNLNGTITRPEAGGEPCFEGEVTADPDPFDFNPEPDASFNPLGDNFGGPRGVFGEAATRAVNWIPGGSDFNVNITGGRPVSGPVP